METSQISGLILENTFTSIPDIVRGWPVIGPLSFACTQRWNSASKIPKIPASLPILFCSGRNDGVVPPPHMDKLWKLAKERGRLAASYRGGVGVGPGIRGRMGGMMCCTPSFGLVLCRGGAGGEEVPTEEWYPPDEDVFMSYTRGGHVDTCTQPGYWPAIENFINKTVSSSTSGDNQLMR
ncbi:hypothetical protein NP233_g9686 [Leucocoprinus birnbaumii]|uniref:Uncharacterized protein n=1 Tax=Leucocoprinus birnbaumii TaxID=56174 RepID=A0AAD5VJZ4_9AGAR|nr:hypothetical protein NP233_g9686 [Leucocoprinus birnbaumii]